MRFIDHLRNHPIACSGKGYKERIDTTPFLKDAVLFDVSEGADQLIESIKMIPGQDASTTELTPKGHELIKFLPRDPERPELGADFKCDSFVGIIAPYETCWFEFPFDKYLVVQDRAQDQSAVKDVGVLLQSLSKESVQADVVPTYPTATTAGNCWVFNRLVDDEHPERIITLLETKASWCSDSEGQLLCVNMKRCGDIQIQPTGVCVTLVALMMLNHGYLRDIESGEVKSRQQRRYEKRHPDRATPDVRYHVLKINPETTCATAGNKQKGGWEVAWHKVRGHLRHYKSGLVVAVRPHSKGNPLKGIVLKDYKIEQPKTKDVELLTIQ